MKKNEKTTKEILTEKIVTRERTPLYDRGYFSKDWSTDSIDRDVYYE